MSYAEDGPLEPNYPEEVSQTFLPNILGYRVLVTQWSDKKYTLNIYKQRLSLNDEDVIEDGETAYDSFPNEDDARLIIERTLEERADWSMQ
jgi:hypothetical protein